jgi:hypothetical protein
MMKHIFFILVWSLMIGGLNAQGSFFKIDRNPISSTIYYAMEHNNYYYVMGGLNDLSFYNNPKGFILKMAPYGNVVNMYETSDSNRFFVQSVDILNDSIIRLFVSSADSVATRMLVIDLDMNLNQLNVKRFPINDTAFMNIYDVAKDEYGNYIVSGGYFTHPEHPNVKRIKYFLYKLSPTLDSLTYWESTRIVKNIIDNPYINRYYTIEREDKYIQVYSRNLDSIKRIPVDTFVYFASSLKLIDKNRVALIGRDPLIYNPNQENTLVRIVDTLGNIYASYSIAAVDTNILPGIGDMISQTLDSQYLYFSFIKNYINASACNYGEPSYIGIGKFDKKLNKLWIKYFSNDSSFFVPMVQTATSDGGVLVAGYMNHCEIYDNIIHYFILKVDSAGEYTFMREFTLPQPAVKIYPNPSQDYVSCDMPFPSGMLKWLIIYDQSGRAVKIISGNDIGKKIDIQELNCGVYLLQLTDKNDRTYTGKFVKE